MRRLICAILLVAVFCVNSISTAAQENLSIQCLAWSPAGDKLAFSLEDKMTIIGADGTLVDKFYLSGLEELPSWSADGRYIALSEVNSDHNTDIFLYDVLTKTRKYVTNSKPQTTDVDWKWLGEHYREPAISPDGKKLVLHYLYSYTDAIQIVGLDKAPTDYRITLVGGGAGADPAWSPDGKNLVMTYIDNSLKFNLLLMNPKGGNWRIILTDKNDNYWFNSPTWSPDGKHIAYVAHENITGGRDYVYVVDINGKNGRLIGEGRCPSWLPDGSKLAITRYTSKRYGVFFVNVNDASDQKEFVYKEQ